MSGKYIRGSKAREKEIHEGLSKIIIAMRTYKIEIGGCGCCGSPFITSEVSGEDYVEDDFSDNNLDDEAIKQMSQRLAQTWVKASDIPKTVSDEAIEELDAILAPIVRDEWGK